MCVRLVPSSSSNKIKVVLMTNLHNFFFFFQLINVVKKKVSFLCECYFVHNTYNI